MCIHSQLPKALGAKLHLCKGIVSHSGASACHYVTQRHCWLGFRTIVAQNSDP